MLIITCEGLYMCGGWKGKYQGLDYLTLTLAPPFYVMIGDRPYEDPTSHTRRRCIELEVEVEVLLVNIMHTYIQT